MSVVSAVCAALASLCAGLAAAAAWLWFRRRRTSIPGPPPLPLLGNALAFYKLPVLWGRFAELHRRYGDIFRLYLGPKLLIVLTQPEDIEKVTLGSRQRERDPYVAHVFRSFLGGGLLSISGETWKRHRRNLEPTFHSEELEKCMGKFNNAADVLCNQLAPLIGKEVDVYRPLMYATFGAASSTIFGIDFQTLLPSRQRQDEVLDAMIEMTSSLPRMIYRPWTTISGINWLTAEGRMLTRFNIIAKSVIDRGFELATKNLDVLKPSNRTILGHLAKETKSQRIFSDEEICDEAMTLGSAGIETLSSTMGYMFTALGLYPEWQDLAQRELDDHFGTGTDYLRAVTTEDIPHLKILDAIVKETGRLFTAVPYMAYQVAEDVPLAGGHVAPRGSAVLLAYYLMHRHAGLFPQPDKFDPGRFLEGGSATTRKAHSYIPFGLGAHKCIGARYAVLQMKVIMATVLRRFRILPGSSREQLEESAVGITSHPLTGFRVTCVPRDNIPYKLA